MKSKWKATVVTALLFILLVVLAADIVAIFPASLPWLLGILAVPGAVWFCKTLYRWLTAETEEKIALPTFLQKKGKHDVDWTRLWAGVPGDEQ